METRIELQQYIPALQPEWDCFIANSRNGTFLFFRNYMDYHSDRFIDNSLLFRYKGKLIAVLPANREGDVLWSHQGLTYGGLVLSSKCTADRVLNIFSLLFSWLSERGFSKLVYKCVPDIYHRYPSQEDLYALFRNNARLVARNLSTTVSIPCRMPFSQLRRRGIKKALSCGIVVQESSDLESFWRVLSENLSDRYNTLPVHTVEEMSLLKGRFPNNIRLFTACKGERVVAGCVIFEMDEWVHSQYISASPEGKEFGALDLLFHYLITDRYSDRKVFDFGQSTENKGSFLNSGLIAQKEGFGGRGIVYDTYELSW